MPRRLTRAESQAQTRARLLKAAAEVFKQRGFENASVEEVAEVAGFSKGAVYANFPSKAALFLAVIDEVLPDHEQALREIFSRERHAAGRIVAAGRLYSEMVKHLREWELLSTEYWLHVQRHPELEEQMARKCRLENEQIASLLERFYNDLGQDPPLPLHQLASLCIATVNGLVSLQMTNPEVVPDELFAIALSRVLGVDMDEDGK
jgi:AcrR family transcriptional regulator